MSIEIDILIIAVATLLAPILGVFISKWLQEKDFKTISRTRQIALIGVWEGLLKQEVGPEGPCEHKLRLTIKVSSKKIFGEISFEKTAKKEVSVIKMVFSGGFLYDRFLQFNYKNTKSTIVQFGSAILELSPKGDKLKGRVVGYGATTEKIVYGGVELTKIS